MTPKTKMLLFCSPVEPDGGGLSRGRDRGDRTLGSGQGIWVLADEIYEHLVYGEQQHSMPVVVPEIADHCLVVNGVAKTYAMTGWRVGWLIGPTDVVKAATNLHSHSSANVANVSQMAALAAVRGDLDAVGRCAPRSTAGDSDARAPERHSRCDCFEPEGAFYAFPNFSGVVGQELRGNARRTPRTRGRHPRRRAGRGSPRRGVWGPGVHAAPYALGDDDLIEGVTRIAKLVAEG